MPINHELIAAFADKAEQIKELKAEVGRDLKTMLSLWDRVERGTASGGDYALVFDKQEAVKVNLGRIAALSGATLVMVADNGKIAVD